MRATIAAFGFAMLAGTAPSIAAPVSPGAIQQATEGMQLTETVHCRPFRHWHRWGFGRGCGAAYIDEGVSVRRYGYRDYGPSFRGSARFGVREGFRGEGRSGVTVRGEGRESVGASGSVRSSTQSTTTSTQSGGTVRPSGQGRMNTAPTGGGASGGANAGGGTGGGAGGAGMRQ
jgi:hypothetical protein